MSRNRKVSYRRAKGAFRNGKASCLNTKVMYRKARVTNHNRKGILFN